MNDIYERQQDDHFVRMQAAARQLYSDEKFWSKIWTIFSLAVAVLGTGAIALQRQYSAFIVLAALVVAVLEIRALPRIHEKRSTAARIQEAYDQELLELPVDETIPEPPSPEIINAAAKRYLDHVDDEEELEGLHKWYAQNVVGKPLAVARVICQKENLWWHSTLRNRVASYITIAVSVIFLLLIAAGLYFQWPLPVFLSGPLLLFSPLLVMGWRNGQTHRQAAKRLAELNRIADDLLEDAERGRVDEITLLWRTRLLQTAIFYQRIADAPVLELFYKLARNRMEKLANTPGQFGEE